MSIDHDISVLNSLIKTTLDSMRGFKEAADDAENTRYAALFMEFSRERGQVARSLRAEVERLGGEPEDETSLLAAAHRTFMNLKQAFTGNDDKAIVAEVERGEDYIKAKFEAALEDNELSQPVLAIVRDAYTSVKAGHDRARDLKRNLVS